MVAVLFSIILLLLTYVVLWGAPWLFYSNLPPGPRPWPIVGNMHILKKAGFQYLGKKYGPIFTFWMGRVPMIVVAGPELMHEALIKKADVFSDKTQLYAMKHLSYNFKTVNTANGAEWRALRRHLLQEVLNQSSIQSYKRVRDAEFPKLIERLKEEAKANDGVVRILPALRGTLFALLVNMCFGTSISESKAREIDENMKDRITVLRGSLGDFSYFMRLYEWRRGLQKEKIRRKMVRKTTELMRPFIVNIREARRRGDRVNARYLETLLDIQDREGVDKLSDENIFALCGELLNAGTSAKSQTLEWVTARLASRPDVQQKMVEEMYVVLGDKRIEESNIDRLPYLRAVVKEVQRMDGPFNVTFPHENNHSGVTLGGYNIPKGASLRFRLDTVSRDAKIWGDPDNFRPERMINEMPDVDMTGTRNMTLLPFGAGKRACPGVALAMHEMYIIVGLLVQSFEWSHGLAGEVDLTSTTGAIAFMKTPFVARIRERQWPPSSNPSVQAI